MTEEKKQQKVEENVIASTHQQQSSQLNNNKKPQQQPQKQNNKKRKEVFPYGNYRAYYGYRIGQDMDEDPRLKVFKKKWFEDKDCLDIGCNNGIVTIQIAKKFGCRSILGLDIDPNRVKDAYWNLRNIARKKSTENTCSKASKLDAAKLSNDSDKKATPSKNGDFRNILRNCSSVAERNLSDVVSFQQENFVQSPEPSPKKLYDTILCLSVSKWVHLNWGDEGVITLFAKIWRLLHPGGVFVLEPQPWKSYKSNRLVSETTAMNYKNILFGPELFQEILLDKIGFRTVEDLTANLSGSKTGFDRPILAFYK